MRFILFLLVQIALLCSHADAQHVPVCSESPDFPVCVQHNLIDSESCTQLIHAAEESGAYDNGFDSLDGKPAMQIDIMEREKVQFHKIFQLVQPHLEKLRDFIGTHFDVSFVYWIFLRKYSHKGNNGRKGVRFHSDSSGATAVVPLNSNYTDGAYVMVNKMFNNENFKGDFEIPKQTKTNNENYYRPPIRQGSALIHDGDILHGVEAVTKGTRYTLIFFFAVKRVDATFHNDLEQTINVYQVQSSENKKHIAQLYRGNQIDIVTKPNEFFIGVDETNGNVVVEWQIGYAPRTQFFQTSQPIRGDDDKLRAMLGEKYNQWAAENPRQDVEKIEL